MNIYLDKDLEDIGVFRDLLTLIKGIVDDPTMDQVGKIDKIYSIYHLWDPVIDYLDFYVQDGGLDWDRARIEYMQNALYAAKGSTYVLDVMGELMETTIDYIYEFPVLEVTFDTYITSNLEESMKRFKTALYYLLYYTKLSVYITNLILSIRDSLVEYVMDINTPYRVHYATIN